MAVVAVSFNGTRINDAEVNTNWGNEPAGGPAPAAETQLKYQNTKAVNKKVVTTASRAGIKYDHTSTINMTAAANKLYFFKGYIADFGDLNAVWGVEARIGSDGSNYHSYNIGGSGANRSVYNSYPDIGGYLITAIDPNISAWRESTTGTPVLGSVDYWAFLAQFIVGGAKSENLALDAIDIGTGLTLVGGDGGDADGTFNDFVSADQETVANRWGIVISQSGAVAARGLLKIGTATATGFADNSSVVIFPDGYHSAGLFGILCDIQNASTVISIGSTIIGGGSSATEDTRPDFVVSGTTGTFEFLGSIQNHRNVTFTSICDVHDGSIECTLLTQSSADVYDCTIRTMSTANVASLQDPTFGTTTDLRNCGFEQAGSGHAIELAGIDATFNISGVTFLDYNASDGQPDSAVFVSAASGITTINITDGDTPTYRSAGATVVINNNVSVTVTVKDGSGGNIQDARVSVRRISDNVQVVGGLTNISGVVSGSAASGTGDVSVRVRKSSGGGTDYIPVNSPQTIGTENFSVTITMTEDPINSS